MTVASLPVKNTFIHFDLMAASKSQRQERPTRVLKRASTDPDPSPVSFGLHQQPGGISATTSLRPACPAGSATEADNLDCSADLPHLLDLDLAELSSPGQTPRFVQHHWENITVPSSPCSQETPEHTPRHASATDESELSQMQSWSLTDVEDGRLSSQQSGSSTPTTASSEGLLERKSCELSWSPQPITQLPAPSSAPIMLEGGFCFSFSLRLAEGFGLGADVAPRDEASQMMLIHNILPNGAMASWNWQCFDGGLKHWKAVWPGDTVVSVNGKTSYAEMLADCKTSHSLKLTVFREVSPQQWQWGCPLSFCHFGAERIPSTRVAEEA